MVGVVPGFGQAIEGIAESQPIWPTKRLDLFTVFHAFLYKRYLIIMIHEYVMVKLNNAKNTLIAVWFSLLLTLFIP